MTCMTSSTPSHQNVTLTGVSSFTLVMLLTDSHQSDLAVIRLITSYVPGQQAVCLLTGLQVYAVPSVYNLFHACAAQLTTVILTQGCEAGSPRRIQGSIVAASPLSAHVQQVIRTSSMLFMGLYWEMPTCSSSII